MDYVFCWPNFVNQWWHDLKKKTVNIRQKGFLPFLFLYIFVIGAFFFIMTIPMLIQSIVSATVIIRLHQ